MKRVKIFVKKKEKYSYIFSAFLQEPDSIESQTDQLEAAVEINEVNFVKNIVAPDSSISEASATFP